MKTAPGQEKWYTLVCINPHMDQIASYVLTVLIEKT
jgi:hypothetical protein